MRYFLFPRRAAAYRIGKLIASAADESAGLSGETRSAGREREDFLQAVISESMKTASDELVTGSPIETKATRVQQAAKRLRKVRASDPKLFSLVMKELEKRSV